MQTSKQYYSLALWVIMLISLSLLSACGGGSGSGSGGSNLAVKNLIGDERPETNNRIDDKFLTSNDRVEYRDFILGKEIVLDPRDPDNKYVGDYGCAEKGCKDALALGYLNDDEDEKFYHDVKFKIKLEKDGDKLKASVPAWFVSDQFNSAEFTVLNGISSDEFVSHFYIGYLGDYIPDDDYVRRIIIRGSLYEGSTAEDVFIAGNYLFSFRDARFDSFSYYGVYALEKIAKNAN